MVPKCEVEWSHGLAVQDINARGLMNSATMRQHRADSNRTSASLARLGRARPYAESWVSEAEACKAKPQGRWGMPRNR